MRLPPVRVVCLLVSNIELSLSVHILLFLSTTVISDVSKPSLLMAIEQETFPTACQPKSPQNNEDSVEALRQQEGKIEITDENMYVTPDMCSCPVDKLFVSHEQDQEDSQSDIDLQVVSSTDAVITNWDVKCGKRTARSQNWYAEIEETDKPKDSLFFMRDEGSQAKIREVYSKSLHSIVIVTSIIL